MLQESGYNLDKRGQVTHASDSTALLNSREASPEASDGRESAPSQLPAPSADTNTSTKQKRGKIAHVPVLGINKTVGGSLQNETNLIDSVAATSVQDRFHFRPVADMPLKCTLSGKSEPLVGGLKYLGHLNSLPSKRNTIVAGIQLNSPEELGTDGTFLGKRYFYAPQKRAYFVPVRNCVPKTV